MNRIKTEVKEVSVLLRSIPSLTMTLFIVSVITTNLLVKVLTCHLALWH